ncbi:MAG: hypothetical protein HYR96_13005 [Deltaproteobacteria bacterium]|nr:hypothetical protein [Deltaproteobacteria bacterium]MBI3295816.1 hypothetical protein [Deltaproteobacteria bacterium]
MVVRGFILVWLTAAAAWALSVREENEVNGRIRRFYSSPSDGSLMSLSVPKYNVNSGEFDQVHRVLELKSPPADPLSRLAQAKATPSYQSHRCKKFLRQKFPMLNCDGPPAFIEPEDNPYELAKSWIRPTAYKVSLDDIPAAGEVMTPVWSGDYWRMQWGLTSYRYAAGEYFGTYKEAIADYAQPANWLDLSRQLTPKKLARAVGGWSPSEKYDLSVSDAIFHLTNQQKNEGKSYANNEGDVESWFGICHGWAAAAFSVPPPLAPVQAIGPNGTKVIWYPDDIRAMATLAWANGRFPANSIGGRCNSKNVELLPNGRVSQRECFDTNPATLHLSLGNLIGIEGKPFVMDATFDYQVWNEPVIRYEFDYFNPLSPEERSRQWQDVVVDYDAQFKKTDRFQKPLTRGERGPGGVYNDSRIRKIVGVIASVNYVSGVPADQNGDGGDPRVIRVTYTYDLELAEVEGRILPVGGEWHENAHPDFLWVPQKGAVAQLGFDSGIPEYSLAAAAPSAVIERANEASASGYPLCKVLRALVDASSGTSTYHCAD